MMHDTKNNVAIITGASKGIGKATAELLSQQGWQVINISRSTCDIAHVTNLRADFNEPNWQADINDALIKAIEHADKITLVHNAALFNKDSITDVAAQSMQQTMDVNIVAPSILNQIVLPHMKAGSSIIYVGSTLSEKAVANTASYCISKHATVGMMRATTQDVANRGIHSCCVCPGFTDTEMFREHIQHDEAVIQAVTQQVTAKRLIAPSEIAKFIQHCVDNPVVNGAVLHANLGQIER